MAQFEVDFPEDFLSEVLEEDFDEICKDALEEAAPIMVESMKRSARQVVEHEGESEMVESISATKPKKAKTDAWILNVLPRGYSGTYYSVKSKSGKTRKYKVSNALKAIWKEYGVNGRQPPRPFLQKAVNDAKEAALQKMQDAYNRRIGAK